jgi:hypothetical protein
MSIKACCDCVVETGTGFFKCVYDFFGCLCCCLGAASEAIKCFFKPIIDGIVFISGFIYNLLLACRTGLSNIFRNYCPRVIDGIERGVQAIRTPENRWIIDKLVWVLEELKIGFNWIGKNLVAISIFSFFFLFLYLIWYLFGVPMLMLGSNLKFFNDNVFIFFDLFQSLIQLLQRAFNAIIFIYNLLVPSGQILIGFLAKLFNQFAVGISAVTGGDPGRGGRQLGEQNPAFSQSEPSQLDDLESTIQYGLLWLYGTTIVVLELLFTGTKFFISIFNLIVAAATGSPGSSAGGSGLIGTLICCGTSDVAFGCCLGELVGFACTSKDFAQRDLPCDCIKQRGGPFKLDITCQPDSYGCDLNSEGLWVETRLRQTSIKKIVSSVSMADENQQKACPNYYGTKTGTTKTTSRNLQPEECYDYCETVGTESFLVHHCGDKVFFKGNCHRHHMQKFKERHPKLTIFHKDHLQVSPMPVEKNEKKKMTREEFILFIKQIEEKQGGGGKWLDCQQIGEEGDFFSTVYRLTCLFQTLISQKIPISPALMEETREVLHRRGRELQNLSEPVRDIGGRTGRDNFRRIFLSGW